MYLKKIILVNFMAWQCKDLISIFNSTRLKKNPVPLYTMMGPEFASVSWSVVVIIIILLRITKFKEADYPLRLSPQP